MSLEPDYFKDSTEVIYLKEVIYKLNNRINFLEDLLDNILEDSRESMFELQAERARANWYRGLAFPDRTKWKWVVYK